jgi:hypothetical protein
MILGYSDAMFDGLTLPLRGHDTPTRARSLLMVKWTPKISGVTSHPWFHPANVYAKHRHALELMVEVLEAAVDDAVPEARRRHPLPELVPGELLGTLVRDTARKIALATYDSQTLCATPSTNLSLHLWTRDGLLRIRVRKLPNQEQGITDDDQLELEFPDDYVENSLFGQVPELALFWVVRGEALYKVILAAPVGWDSVPLLSTWYGWVEIHAPAVRTLTWPLPGMLPQGGASVSVALDDLDDAVEPLDDLDDAVEPLFNPDGEEEAPGNAS